MRSKYHVFIVIKHISNTKLHVLYDNCHGAHNGRNKEHGDEE